MEFFKILWNNIWGNGGIMLALMMLVGSLLGFGIFQIFGLFAV